VAREFGPAGLGVRFALPPGQAESFEAAWRERSRGGRVDWEA
jgi:hypothetical protein